jgi:hypothetical protein
MESMKNLYIVCSILFGSLLITPLLVNADSDPSEPNLSSFSIPLAADTWNLVSIPFDLPDESIAGVFGDALNSVDTIYMYAPEISGEIGEKSNPWFVYRAGHPELSTLKTIQPGFGYFVHTTSEGIISGRGTLFSSSSTPPSRHLVAGWNLVGVFEPQSTSSGDIDQVFGSIGFSGVDYLALWKLDPSTASFTTPDTASQGDAFWMLLDAPHTYGPTNF